MWTFFSRLIAQLREISQLLAEQNGLLRELVQFHTRRSAITPLALSSRPIAPPRASTPRTASNVFRHSREDELTTEEEARQRVMVPFRQAKIDIAQEPMEDRPIEE